MIDVYIKESHYYCIVVNTANYISTHDLGNFFEKTFMDT